MKRLIINADDFGLTAGVNAAILELHQHGPLRSATLMAQASATEQAIRLASANKSLGIGCHLVLLDGSPVLPAANLPSLVRQHGHTFAPTLMPFAGKLLLNRKAIPAEIQAETCAQLALLQKRGLHLTHIDTHKHAHMVPAVLRAVLQGAKALGLSVVRNPFEPAWSIHATPRAPWLRRIQVRILRSWEPAFRRIVREEGFQTTDGAIGVLATGTLDAATLASLLRAIPKGTWELVTHPGYNDPALARAGTRLLASREVELASLLAAAIPDDVELIHFGQLAQRDISVP